MTNPLKSQIAANRERFEKDIAKTEFAGGEYPWKNTEFDEEIKSALTTSQTSLLQTAIAAVEGMKISFVNKKTSTGLPEDWENLKNDIHNQALSKVVELLKGGIENI